MDEGALPLQRLNGDSGSRCCELVADLEGDKGGREEVDMMDDGAAGAGISFSVVFALLLLLLLLLFFVDEDPTRVFDPFFVFVIVSTFSLSSPISLADLT